MKQRGDGVLIVLRGEDRLRFMELKAKAAKAKAKKPIVNNRRYKPAATHPWNRGGPERTGVPGGGLAPAAPERDHHPGRKAG